MAVKIFGKHKYRYDTTFKSKLMAKDRAKRWRRNGLIYARVVKNWAGTYDVYVTAPLGARPGEVGYLYKR